MKRFLAYSLLLSLICCCCMLSSCTTPREKFSAYSFEYFDTVTTITGFERTKEEFDAISNEIMAELETYHRLFTVYDRYEGFNNLCTVNTLYDGAHKEVEVDQRIIDMLLFSKDMYEKTGGKVNIAMGSVLSIWHDYREDGINDPSTAALPPMDKLQQAALHIDIEKMIVNDERNTVFLADPEMRLDVGAIAKGYAVEKVAQMLIGKGISGYVINVGGNVRAVGPRDGGEKWLVGIENPDGTDDDPYYTTLGLDNVSLVTSGSYQRYYIVNGKNYNHIIDPDTLMPADRYVSVSVLCESSALADALSTALFSMDVDSGERLISSFDSVEAMWVLNSGEIKYSDGFSKYISN